VQLHLMKKNYRIYEAVVGYFGTSGGCLNVVQDIIRANPGLMVLLKDGGESAKLNLHQIILPVAN